MKRCPVCDDWIFGYGDRHTCLPKWRVWDEDNGEESDAKEGSQAPDPRCQPDRPRTGEELTRPRCEALVQRADGRLQVQRQCWVGFRFCDPCAADTSGPVCEAPQDVHHHKEDPMANFRDRYHPVAARELIDRMRRFPILAVALDHPNAPENPIGGLTESSHQTTARLSTFLCGHFFDGDAAGIDVIDLIRRLDSENKAALLAYLANL